MKKIAFVLALIFAFGSVMLASCNNEAEESSAAESVVSSVSEETVESSVADASSETESSVGDESSETEEPKEPLVITGTNIAKGKSYTVSGCGTGYVNLEGQYPANYNGDLTDGYYADENNYDGKWFAFRTAFEEDPATLNTVDGIGTLVFDLGTKADLTALRIHMYNNSGAGIQAPNAITAYSSENGTDFEQLGKVYYSKEDEVYYWAELALECNTQYIKIEFDTNTFWTFLDEVEIYATEAGSDEPDESSKEPEEESKKPSGESTNVAKGKKYTISGSGKPGGQYTASLTDGNAADTISFDANWFAFYNNGNDASAINAPEGKGYIIIDLGKKTDLSKIRLHLGNEKDAGVPTPAWVEASVCDTADGEFAYISNFELKDHTQAGNEKLAYWTEIDASGKSGRYVKISVTVNGTWCFMNEIEVYNA
ncbi:MAG: hypothetical protein IJB49_02335 [Clostridia bacterium]|nr:hypothetical protein [Clostridia bacterium]